MGYTGHSTIEHLHHLHSSQLETEPVQVYSKDSTVQHIKAQVSSFGAPIIQEICLGIHRDSNHDDL